MPRISGGEALKALVLGGAAIFLAWQVFKTSAVEGLLHARPLMAAQIAPGDPRVATEIAMQEFRRRNGNLSRKRSIPAIASLKRAPLAEEPFLLAGLIARVNGDPVQGERLLAEARRRNPRSRAARLVLLDRYLRSNQVPEAAAEIRVMTALVPQVSTVLVPELARMARNRKTREAMVGVLKQDAEMRQSVLKHLATSGADPDLILRIAQAERRGPGTEAPWQSLLLQNLIEKGDVRRAYAIWRSFVRADVPADEKPLYDGRFQGLPGSAPFNWTLGQSNAGVAERGKSSGLDVAYYGRLPTELATQLLILRPGRYRLTVQAEGSAKGEGSRLVWTVACQPKKQVLVELPLRNIIYKARRLAGEFSVPASGCAAQWLRLAGVQGEFATAQNVTIGEVEIRKAGTS